eukprot:TRINITY_DN11595_c0_g1_i2.p1 TRINITY_DN11595_c0_g1~~TRINITY_DN11595_c0_g1_i2.p1  ORF type:complete len:139 (-),score=33.40 TRINITY_DN11595_c0_g1_i2:602-1018(-)
MNLTVLNIEKNNIQSRGAEIISKALEGNKVLTVLNFSKNDIKKEGLEWIVKAIHNESAIQYLNLSNCGIDAEAGKMLYELLKSNSLRSLDISINLLERVEYNNLGRKAIEELAKGLGSNKKLLYLNICNISSAAYSEQ